MSAHRDKITGNKGSEIPAETRYLASGRKRSVCEDWMVVCAVSCEPVSKQISLVSGNFTGNFAILGLRDTITCQETATLQPLLEQFPTQIISENILKNSEFSNGIRDLLLKNQES